MGVTPGFRTGSSPSSADLGDVSHTLPQVLSPLLPGAVATLLPTTPTPISSCGDTLDVMKPAFQMEFTWGAGFHLPSDGIGFPTFFNHPFSDPTVGKNSLPIKNVSWV